MNNKLSEYEIDKDLMDRDKRKPIRKLVDAVTPAAAMLLGGVAAAGSALANIKVNPRLKVIE